MEKSVSKVLLDKTEMGRALQRMANEIVEENRGVRDLVIVGIRTRGVYLGQRICAEIKKMEREDIPFGILDITLYRDDVGSIAQPHLVKETSIPFDVTGKKVVLVDDVLFTGRSIRAALDEVMDFGRPKKIQLAVLIDRGHRELPIQADFIGKVIPTSNKEKVKVELKELDKKEQVVLLQ